MLSKLTRVLPNIQKAYKTLSKKFKKNDPFPLFQLPQLVLEMVLQEYDSIEILNLSACSKNSTKVIKSFKKRKRAEACFVYLRGEKPNITVTFNTRMKNLRWIFDFEKKLTKKDILENRHLQGNTFKIAYLKKTPNEIWCRQENILECFPLILKHFLDLFPVSIRVIVEPDIGELTQLFSTPLFSKFAELEFTRGYKGKVFGKHEVERICRRVCVTKTLNILTNLQNLCLRGYNFNVEYLTLDNARWMGRSDFLGIDSRVVKFNNHHFCIDDIEKVAIKWQLNPVRPRLERMEFGWEPFENPTLEKIRTFQWDRRNRSKRCLKYVNHSDGGTIDCSQAQDFLRRDGLLASIGRVESNGRNLVIFQVWHDRFPTKPYEDLLEKKRTELYKQLPVINRENGLGCVAEVALTNPNLTSDQFDELLHETYASRLGPFESSPQLEKWFEFHVQILDTKKEIEYYT